MKQYQIDRIKDLMDAKGITTKELASMCHISEMTIRRILTQGHNPTTDTIEIIAEALGVHEQYIYEAEGETKSKLPINGFIEYGGTISSIRTFKQLEKVYEGIKYDMSVPRLVKELRAKDKENKKSQTPTEIDITKIDLRRPEEYDTSKVKTWSFLHTDDVRDGISINIGNFSTDHELDLCGEHFYHSESAYIVGLFSQNTEESIRIQREVQYEKSPMDAKYTVRAKYTKQGKSRKDWDDFKHQWMLYVVWQKCLTNDEFAELLRLVPNDVIIIENTTNQTNGRKEDDSSDYWGAKNKELEDGHDLIEREVELANPTMAARELKKLKSIERNKLNNVGIWKGINCLGKVLNICKYCLDTDTTPPIDYDLLRSKQIYLFGKLLTFEKPLPPKHQKQKLDFYVDPQKGLNVLSLFDGIGCAMQALKELGIKVNHYYASEIETASISIARKNHPKIIELGDVSNWKDWQIDWSEIDLLVGGSPCQGFTFAGKRLKFEDERSKLILHYFEIVEHIRKVKGDKFAFLLENVKMDADSKNFIDEVLGVKGICINSNLFSSQNRDRIYWCNFDVGKLPTTNEKVLKDIVDDEANKNPKLYLTKKHMEGFLRSYKWKPQTLDEKSRPILATYYKLPPHVPYIPYTEKNVEESPYSQFRMLSTLECERLQTLPDGYTEYGEDGKEISTPTRLKTLGNGFTVAVVKFILQGLKENFATPSPTTTKSKYRTVIFDFDGTLVDTRPLFKYRYLIKGKSRWNDPEGFQKAYKEFSEHLKDCKPFDGIDEVLQFIKENNITAYIVTGGSKGKAEDAIKLFGWEGVFKGAIGRFSVNNTKKITKADNNPILFRKALADIEEDASNCISFGNELVDCHAARKAGIESYCVYWGAEGEDKEIMDGEMKDLTIHNPLEIIDILKSDPKEVILTEDEQLELLGEPIIPNKGIMGALVGDFLGSVYERRPYKDIPLDKELEHKYGMKCTDDTVQTLAVAQWLMIDPEHKHETLIKLMKRYGKKYRKESHGEQFRQWIESKDNKPNDLEEDGSAMRVSPVAYYAKSLEECLELAKISAEVSHNSQEGIYGAQASAAAVYMYLHGSSKDEIKEYISNTFGYDLNTTTNDIRPTYKLETLCSKVVPQAIVCFLEGETYEDVIKLAISLGGDADTQGAIAGAIAAAKMPIPQIKADLCYENLPADLKHILLSFYDCLSNKAFPEPTKPSEQITSKTDDETQKKLKKLGFKSLAELYKARDEILSSEVARTKKCEVNWLDAKPISWDDFSFRRPHEYDTQKQECWSFSKGVDVRDGISLQLGNMVNGFGVSILGIDFVNSEVPYQLAIFKNDEESIKVQKEVIDTNNPLFSNGLAMKRVYVRGKEYAPFRRDKDFELGDKSWCFEWMKWVVWEKAKQNKGFRDILLSVPRNAVIIEKAQKESEIMWGAWNDELIKQRDIVITAAELESGKGKTSKTVMETVYKVNNVGVWRGENAMGQILTMCKLALNEGVNLPIDEQLLNDAEICWFGQVLHFTKDAQGNVSVEAR